jgi:hypothetical protein
MVEFVADPALAADEAEARVRGLISLESLGGVHDSSLKLARPPSIPSHSVWRSSRNEVIANRVAADALAK